MIIKEFALAHFPSNDVLNFALNVEKVTTAKVLYDNYNNSMNAYDLFGHFRYPQPIPNH